MHLKNVLTHHKESNKLALIHGEDTITYKELHNQVKNNQTFMLERFPNIHSNVGIYLSNSIDYVISYFTIAYMNRVIVPIPIQFSETEIKNTIEYCNLNFIITNNKAKPKLLKILRDTKQHIIIYNLDDGKHEELGCEKCDDIKVSEDVVLLLTTSGTTSHPKRVMLTHENLYSNINSVITSLNLTKDDRTLIVLPIYFGYCNTSQFLSHLSLGATIVIMDNVFMPNKLLKLIENEKITNFTAVPTMLLMLLNYGKIEKYNLSSLRLVCFGGGAISKENIRNLFSAFKGISFIQTYGQTEASPRLTCLFPDDSVKKIGSIGKALPGVEIKIVNEKGIEVPPGIVGEIIASGKNIMKGYYKLPEQTKRVIKNGWLYTGDLATVDKEGYIFLFGRKNNLIISGGLNIYPEEIESVLTGHNSVKEALVIGEDDALLGEVPVAKVVLRESKETSKEELLKWCIKSLPNYKVPRGIKITTKLEKTYTEKIKRKDGVTNVDC